MFTGNWTCDVFKENLLKGAVNVDKLKIALYTKDASLNAETVEYTADNEVVADGYTAGGQDLTAKVEMRNGIAFISFEDAVWQGKITARGALIYQDTGSAVCVLDFGADITSAIEFKVQFPPSTDISALLRIG